ncbi:MAG: hypothetical protein KI793_15275 [Rivularia sp. (in: Bacteria)]|nr:hypothetical protein [Rivularia sp. MS3]
MDSFFLFGASKELLTWSKASYEPIYPLKASVFAAGEKSRLSWMQRYKSIIHGADYANGTSRIWQ